MYNPHTPISGLHSTWATSSTMPLPGFSGGKDKNRVIIVSKLFSFCWYIAVQEFSLQLYKEPHLPKIWTTMVTLSWKRIIWKLSRGAEQCHVECTMSPWIPPPVTDTRQDWSMPWPCPQPPRSPLTHPYLQTWLAPTGLQSLWPLRLLCRSGEQAVTQHIHLIPIALQLG